MVQGVALEAATVVVRGAINPIILTPQWLLSQEIVGQVDFERLEVEVISREVVSFSMSWLNVNATVDSMTFSSSDPDELLRVRDVTQRVLELLSHTPIAALGINRTFHTSTDSIDQFHAIGDALAPKDLWESQLRLPGMRDITIQGIRDDLYGGYVQVAVQPSTVVERGVFLLHNDHYELSRVDHQPERRSDFFVFEPAAEATPEKNEVALEVLRDRFEDSLARAEQVRQTVMGAGGAS